MNKLTRNIVIYFFCLFIVVQFVFLFLFLKFNGLKFLSTARDHLISRNQQNNNILWGNFAFSMGDNIYVWTLFGLKSISLTSKLNTKIIYAETCSKKAVDLRHDFLYFGKIFTNTTSLSDVNDRRSILRNIKSGFPVTIELRSSGIVVTISDEERGVCI